MRCFCRSAAASVDLPDEGSPKRITCFDGIDRDEDTESRIEDHRSCGGSSGDAGRESSIVRVAAKVATRRVADALPLLEITIISHSHLSEFVLCYSVVHTRY